MTHSPPIPTGNQSPYPLVEPPHVRPVETAPPVRRKAPDDARANAPALAIGAIAVAAAGIAAFVFARRKAEQTPEPTKQRSRRTRQAPVRRKAATPKSTAPKSAPPKATAKRKRQLSADDTSNHGPQDASRIAMGEDYEVRYWTKKFGVDRDALQSAVDAVGTGADAVEQELRKS